MQKIIIAILLVALSAMLLGCTSEETKSVCGDTNCAMDENTLGTNYCAVDCNKPVEVLEVAYTCTDTDNGNTSAIKGAVTLVSQDGGEVFKEDYCDGNTLKEYSCADYNTTKLESLIDQNCEYGCTNGACVQKSEVMFNCDTNVLCKTSCDSNEVVDTNSSECGLGGTNSCCVPKGYVCVDTDGGKEIKIRGQTYRNDGGYWTDMCFGDNQINEGYCNPESSSGVSTVIMSCTLGCTQGACR